MRMTLRHRRFALSAVLLLACLALLPAAASANRNGGALSLGVNKTVNIGYAGERVDLYFTPSTYGVYVLTSYGSLDTVANLYTTGGALLLNGTFDGVSSPVGVGTFTVAGGTLSGSGTFPRDITGTGATAMPSLAGMAEILTASH